MPTYSGSLNVNQKLDNWVLSSQEREQDSGEGKEERSTASWVTATPVFD